MIESAKMVFKMKLKDFAIEILISELKPKEMLAIYLMAAGSKMSDSVQKVDLAKIISFLCQSESVQKLDLAEVISILCKKLGWVEGQEDNSDQTTTDILNNTDQNLLEKMDTSNTCDTDLDKEDSSKSGEIRDVQTKPNTEDCKEDTQTSKPKPTYGAYENDKDMVERREILSDSSVEKFDNILNLETPGPGVKTEIPVEQDIPKLIAGQKRGQKGSKDTQPKRTTYLVVNTPYAPSVTNSGEVLNEDVVKPIGCSLTLKCKVCSEDFPPFSRKGNLTYHFKLVHKIDPMYCRACNNIYQAKNIERHNCQGNAELVEPKSNLNPKCQTSMVDLQKASSDYCRRLSGTDHPPPSSDQISKPKLPSDQQKGDSSSKTSEFQDVQTENENCEGSQNNKSSITRLSDGMNIVDQKDDQTKEFAEQSNNSAGIEIIKSDLPFENELHQSELAVKLADAPSESGEFPTIQFEDVQIGSSNNNVEENDDSKFHVDESDKSLGSGTPLASDTTPQIHQPTANYGKVENKLDNYFKKLTIEPLGCSLALKCNICNKSVSRKDCLVRHLKVVHNLDPLYCKECKNIYQSKNIQEHDCYGIAIKKGLKDYFTALSESCTKLSDGMNVKDKSDEPGDQKSKLHPTLGNKSYQSEPANQPYESSNIQDLLAIPVSENGEESADKNYNSSVLNDKSNWDPKELPLQEFFTSDGQMLNLDPPTVNEPSQTPDEIEHENNSPDGQISKPDPPSLNEPYQTPCQTEQENNFPIGQTSKPDQTCMNEPYQTPCQTEEENNCPNGQISKPDPPCMNEAYQTPCQTEQENNFPDGQMSKPDPPTENESCQTEQALSTQEGQINSDSSYAESETRQSEVLACPVCAFIFSSEDEFAAHEKAHEHEPPQLKYEGPTPNKRKGDPLTQMIQVNGSYYSIPPPKRAKGRPLGSKNKKGTIESRIRLAQEQTERSLVDLIDQSPGEFQEPGSTKTNTFQSLTIDSQVDPLQNTLGNVSFEVKEGLNVHLQSTHNKSQEAIQEFVDPRVGINVTNQQEISSPLTEVALPSPYPFEQPTPQITSIKGSGIAGVIQINGSYYSLPPVPPGKKKLGRPPGSKNKPKDPSCKKFKPSKSSKPNSQLFKEALEQTQESLSQDMFKVNGLNRDDVQDSSPTTYLKLTPPQGNGVNIESSTPYISADIQDDEFQSTLNSVLNFEVKEATTEPSTNQKSQELIQEAVDRVNISETNAIHSTTCDVPVDPLQNSLSNVSFEEKDGLNEHLLLKSQETIQEFVGTRVDISGTNQQEISGPLMEVVSSSPIPIEHPISQITSIEGPETDGVIQLNGSYNPIPNPRRGRGRPPGSKNKPKVVGKEPPKPLKPRRPEGYFFKKALEQSGTELNLTSPQGNGINIASSTPISSHNQVDQFQRTLDSIDFEFNQAMTEGFQAPNDKSQEIINGAEERVDINETKHQSNRDDRSQKLNEYINGTLDGSEVAKLYPFKLPIPRLASNQAITPAKGSDAKPQDPGPATPSSIPFKQDDQNPPKLRRQSSGHEGSILFPKVSKSKRLSKPSGTGRPVGRPRGPSQAKPEDLSYLQRPKINIPPASGLPQKYKNKPVKQQYFVVNAPYKSSEDPQDMIKQAEDVDSQTSENNPPKLGRPSSGKNKPKCLTTYSTVADTKEVTEVSRDDFYKMCPKRRSERNSVNSSVEQGEESTPLTEGVPPEYLE